jgi:hypothetical protein
MALESTQPLAEMSTRNLPGGKERSALKLTISPPFVSRLSRKCGSLEFSHLYGPLRPVRGIALPFLFLLLLQKELSNADQNGVRYFGY